MNGSGVRVYLSKEERAALARAADERGSSLSYVMRLALRILVGLSIPEAVEREERERRAAAR